MEDLKTIEKTPGGRRLILRALVLALFAAVAFCLYWPALDGPFVLDDGWNITQNWQLRVKDLSPGSLLEAGFSGITYARAVPKISFAVTHYFFGYDPAAFRAGNIGVHALAGFALYLFLLAFFDTPYAKNRGLSPGPIPFLAALAWLVHPLNVNGVAYIVQRMNEFSSLFFMAALLGYVRVRLAPGKKGRAAWGVFAILSFALALLSKENAAVLPVVVLVFEWFFIQDLSRGWIRRYGWVFGGIFVFLALAYLIYSGFRPLEPLTGPYTVRDFTMGERVLTEFRVLILYLTLLFLPLPGRLSLVYDFPISRSLLSPITTLPALLLLLALLASAFVLAGKRRLYSFAVLWFFITLAMESSVIGLEIVFEHRMYLPSMVPVFFLVTLVFGILKNRTAATAVTAALILLLGAGTYAASRTWSDAVTFWRHAVERAPGSARAHQGMSLAYYRAGEPENALAHAREAVRLKPGETDAYYNLGRALEHPAIGRLDEAIEAYRKAVDLGARDVNALNNLQFALAKAGRREEAESALNAALAVAPDDPNVLYNAGRSLLFLNEPDRAMDFFETALARDPGYAEARRDLGLALARKGDFDRAREALVAARQGLPEDENLLYNLGVVCLNLGKPGEAGAVFQELVKNNPGHVDAMIQAGEAAAATGSYRGAMEWYALARKAAPGSLMPLERLARTSFLTGQYDKAAAYLKEVAALDRYGATGAEARTRAERIVQAAARRREAARAVLAQAKKEPENAVLWDRAGVLLHQAGDLAEAEKTLEKALAQAPESTDTLNNLGLVRMTREDYDRAREDFLKALAADPANIPALYNLACLASRLNRTDEAAGYLDRLVDAGFSEKARLFRDEDLKNLRRTPAFREIVSRMDHASRNG